MGPKTELKRLLALKGSLRLNGVLALLRQACDVVEVDELDSALDAMRNNRFDAVLAETSDFLPLERISSTQQAAAVLDTLSEGVCVVGPGGELIWANPRMRQMTSAQVEKVIAVCLEALEGFSPLPEQNPGETKRFSLPLPGEKFCELTCSPIYDRQGQLRHVAAVLADTTTRRQQQQTITALERLGQELSRLDTDACGNRPLPERLGVLKDRIISCAKEVLNFDHLAILLKDSEQNRLMWLLAEGLSDQARQNEFLISMEGNGICGYVAATGRSYLCADIQTDPLYVAGLDGACSSITVPLMLRGQVVGVLNIESACPTSFGQYELHFAEIFAAFLPLAVQMLQLGPDGAPARDSQADETIEPVALPAGPLDAPAQVDLAGPLSDVITAAAGLMEDYIGHDDLRLRLQDIIDKAAAIRSSAQPGPPAPAPLRAITPTDEPSDVSQAKPTPAPPVPLPVPAPAPMAESAPPPLPATTQAESPRTDRVLEGKRVLVADDEAIIRKLIHDILAPCGCVVDLAPDGVEAIANMAEHQYDLVVTDVNMPGASGYEVLAAARTNGTETPVILVTGFGYDPNNSIVQACQTGQAKTLFKPFKVNELVDLARQAVQGD